MDVSKYVKEHHEMTARLVKLEAQHLTLFTLCFDVVRQSEKRKDEVGDYMHYIEPGTWRRLVATVSVQTEMFKKGDG